MANIENIVYSSNQNKKNCVFFKIGNTDNLKETIQKYSVTEETYLNVLNNVGGDTQAGVPFNDVVLYSLNYFFTHILEGETKNHYWNLNFVKAAFDNSNYTPYTPIISLPSEKINLKEAELFNQCYLIVQFAWYLNHINLKEHQFFKYSDYYIRTKQSLPLNEYKHDLNYLLKKYKDYDEATINEFKITSYSLLKTHFFGSLYIIINELGLSNKNFKQVFKAGREYTPTPKIAREFRKYFPVLINQCDIKSAYPSFIDLLLDTSVKGDVYNNIMTSFGLDRPAAKTEYNRMLNSGKYRTREELTEFFACAGYNEKAGELVTMIKSKEFPMWKRMQLMEQDAINTFIEYNQLQRGSRLHDAVLFIDDQYQKEQKKEFVFYDFGLEQLNEVEASESLDFRVKPNETNKKYISSIPVDFYTNYKGVHKQTAKGGYYINAGLFDVYTEDFESISASVNVGKIDSSETEFLNELKKCFRVLRYLNDVGYLDLFDVVLSHIQTNGVYLFNKKYITSVLIPAWDLEPAENIDDLIKVRNWDYVGMRKLSRSEFLSELHKSKLIYKTHSQLYAISNAMKKGLETPLFIDKSEVGINRDRDNVYVSKLIDRYNIACIGCSDVRKASKYIKIIKVLQDVDHNNNSTYINVGEMLQNKEISKLSSLVNVNYRALKDYSNIKQDRREMLEIINEVEYLIQNPNELEIQQITETRYNKEKDAEETIRRNITTPKAYVIKEKEQQTYLITPQEAFDYEEPLKNSSLNVPFEQAVQMNEDFYLSWYMFHNKDLTEGERSECKKYKRDLFIQIWQPHRKKKERNISERLHLVA